MDERSGASLCPTMLAEQADRLSALFEVHADRLYRLARRLRRHGHTLTATVSATSCGPFNSRDQVLEPHVDHVFEDAVGVPESRPHSVLHDFECGSSNE